MVSFVMLKLYEVHTCFYLVQTSDTLNLEALNCKL